MSDWQVTWLGVIAVAVALMALIQIVVLVAVARLAMQAARGVKEIRQEIRPLIDKVNRLADDATRVSAMAVGQIQRIDALVTAAALRVDETMGVVQKVVMGPVRQGSAVMAAVRALVTGFRSRADRRAARRDDEDPLFVG